MKRGKVAETFADPNLQLAVKDGELFFQYSPLNLVEYERDSILVTCQEVSLKKSSVKRYLKLVFGDK